jgi:hypothetical protein
VPPLCHPPPRSAAAPPAPPPAHPASPPAAATAAGVGTAFATGGASALAAAGAIGDFISGITGGGGESEGGKSESNDKLIATGFDKVPYLYKLENGKWVQSKILDQGHKKVRQTKISGNSFVDKKVYFNSDL